MVGALPSTSPKTRRNVCPEARVLAGRNQGTSCRGLMGVASSGVALSAASGRPAGQDRSTGATGYCCATRVARAAAGSGSASSLGRAECSDGVPVALPPAVETAGGVVVPWSRRAGSTREADRSRPGCPPLAVRTSVNGSRGSTVASCNLRGGTGAGDVSLAGVLVLGLPCARSPEVGSGASSSIPVSSALRPGTSASQRASPPVRAATTS